MSTEQNDKGATTPSPERLGSALVAYKMTNGNIVHPECRTDYVSTFKERAPAIDAGLMDGYAFSRFQLCKHCDAPITDRPNTGRQVRREMENGNE